VTKTRNSKKLYSEVTGVKRLVPSTQLAKLFLKLRKEEMLYSRFKKAELMKRRKKKREKKTTCKNRWINLR